MRYTYLDLIEEVLRSEKREMTLGEIWEVAEEKGYRHLQNLSRLCKLYPAPNPEKRTDLL